MAEYMKMHDLKPGMLLKWINGGVFAYCLVLHVDYDKVDYIVLENGRERLATEHRSTYGEWRWDNLLAGGR